MHGCLQIDIYRERESLYIHTYISCVCTRRRVDIHVHVHRHGCACVFCVCMRIHICMYIYIYVYMYVPRPLSTLRGLSLRVRVFKNSLGACTLALRARREKTEEVQDRRANALEHSCRTCGLHQVQLTKEDGECVTCICSCVYSSMNTYVRRLHITYSNMNMYPNRRNTACMAVPKVYFRNLAFR